MRALRDAPRGARFQVQGSLDRFIKSAPEGLKRAAEAAIPVAKVFTPIGAVSVLSCVLCLSGHYRYGIPFEVSLNTLQCQRDLIQCQRDLVQ